MDFVGIILASGILLVIMVGYFLYITRPQGKNNRSGGRVDLSIAPAKWAELQAMMKDGGPANYRQSIMEADKLVDLVLKSKVSGETMGERLKNAKHLFSRDTYDKLWTAHKIRNKVAHEADFEGLSSDASLAIRNFEKALKELRII
jgi:hypothetical protein